MGERPAWGACANAGRRRHCGPASRDGTVRARGKFQRFPVHLFKYGLRLRRLFEIMLVIDYGIPAHPICGPICGPILLASTSFLRAWSEFESFSDFLVEIARLWRWRQGLQKSRFSTPPIECLHSIQSAWSCGVDVALSPADGCRSTTVCCSGCRLCFLPRDEQAHRMHALSLRLEGLHVLQNPGPGIKDPDLHCSHQVPPNPKPPIAARFSDRPRKMGPKICPLLLRLKPMISESSTQAQTLFETDGALGLGSKVRLGMT